MITNLQKPWSVKDSSDSTSKDSNSTVSKKRKRRTPGNFPCTYQNCLKTFTRAEHLARHKLNHNPLIIYKCDWEGCERTFVRNDLKTRHMQRHLAKSKKDEESKDLEIKSKKNSLFNGMNTISFDNNKEKKMKAEVSNNNDATSPTFSEITINNNIKHNGQVITSLNFQDSVPLVIDESSLFSHIEKDKNINLSVMNSVSKERDQSISSNSVKDNDEFDVFRNSPHNSSNHSDYRKHNDAKALFDNIPSSPANIDLWINSNLMNRLSDFTSDNNYSNNVAFGSSNDFFFGLSPNNYINDIISYMIPETINEENISVNKYYLITPETMSKILLIIPTLTNEPDTNIEGFERCLQIYWEFFHIQFPFLHRPSFIASEASELLLLSMIMLGAGLSFATGKNESKLVDPRGLADSICIPLRWKLFESSDFNLPVKTWVIQSLLLLEYYEKFFTTRLLHERTFIHHGSIIQLLRRTPTLAGNPTKSDHNYNPKAVEEELNDKSDEEKKKILWQKWIEFESLKRTTLMAFYVDSTHSIIFGHLGMLYAHQIQVEMPCDDDLWESNWNNFKFPTNKLKPKLFLQELRKLIKGQSVKTGVFGNRILMTGLLSIITQFQQRDLQASALEFDNTNTNINNEINGSWKEYMSFILDFFTHDTMKGCCDTRTGVFINQKKLADEDSPKLATDAFDEFDTRCKYPAYHVAHIILKISHYDLIMYSGAPWRMSVRPTIGDYEIVKSRVEKWSKGTSGRLSVIHAYLYLFEMFLVPGDQVEKAYDYKCLADPIMERSYVMYLSALTIWAYNFTIDGPEQNLLNDLDPGDYPEIKLLPSLENGYSYLKRIKKELTSKTRIEIHNFPALDTANFHKITLLQAKILPSIKDKRNVTGLLKLVSDCLIVTNWQLAKEFSFMFKHCIERSLGSKSFYARQYFEFFNFCTNDNLNR